MTLGREVTPVRRQRKCYESGPQITSFRSISYCYNIDEGVNQFSARVTVFVGFFWVPPCLKDVHVR